MRMEADFSTHTHTQKCIKKTGDQQFRMHTIDWKWKKAMLSCQQLVEDEGKRKIKQNSITIDAKMLFVL